jgi:hypothetical protein
MNLYIYYFRITSKVKCVTKVTDVVKYMFFSIFIFFVQWSRFENLIKFDLIYIYIYKAYGYCKHISFHCLFH